MAQKSERKRSSSSTARVVIQPPDLPFDPTHQPNEHCTASGRYVFLRKCVGREDDSGSEEEEAID
eukprot:3219139-Rhodomonas_salina.1